MAAAPTSKPGWVHYSCAFLFISTLFLSIGLYLTISGAKETEAARVAAEKKANEATTASTRALDWITTLKNKIGYTYEAIGTEEGKEPNTVAGGMNADIDAAADPAVKSYRALVLSLLDQLNTAKTGIANKDNEIAQLNDQIAKLKGQYNAQVAQVETDKSEVEKNLTAATTASAEERAKKDKEIDDQRASLKTLQEEYAKLEDDFKKSSETAEKTAKSLRDSIARLNKKIVEMSKEDFDAPLGKISEVDNDAHIVTINLGSADRLKVLTTFSVYTKADTGTAGGSEDIKGSIKVIKILGPHLAQAAITTEVLKSNPISPGDPIFTPLWTPGQTEKIAVVGVFDLDGDGKHDQEQLMELLKNNGATLGAYADQKGERHNGRVDFYTKYLVIGKIADITEVTDAEDRRAVEEVAKSRDKMKQEAEENGVRLIRMTDFIRKTGYKTQSRRVPAGQLAPNKATIRRSNDPAYDTKD